MKIPGMFKNDFEKQMKKARTYRLLYRNWRGTI